MPPSPSNGLSNRGGYPLDFTVIVFAGHEIFAFCTCKTGTKFQKSGDGGDGLKKILGSATRPELEV